MHPVAAVDEKRLARLITELDSDDFTIREKVAAELQKLDVQALPAYRKALDVEPCGSDGNYQSFLVRMNSRRTFIVI